MIEHYKKPSVKFIVNKGNFNKLMALLAFQEENIVTEEWKEKEVARFENGLFIKMGRQH